MTNRAMARLLGRLIFFLHISLIPMLGSSDGRTVIQAMSKLGRDASKRGWDSPRTFDVEQLTALRTIWKKVIDGRPFPTDSTESAERPRDWVVISDASSGGWGYEGYHLDHADEEDTLHIRPLLDEHGERPVREMDTFKICDTRHIYYKEMEAACSGIRRIFKHLRRRRRRRGIDDEPELVLVVVDNSAVAWGLRHGFTDNEGGMKLLETIQEHLNHIEVVQVVSRDNPSDCHSRNDFHDYNERVQRVEMALQAHLKGNRTGQAASFDKHGREILRHRPPEEELDIHRVEGEFLFLESEEETVEEEEERVF